MTSPFIYRDFNGLLPVYSLVCIENKWGSRFRSLLYKTILPIYLFCVWMNVRRVANIQCGASLK